MCFEAQLPPPSLALPRVFPQAMRVGILAKIPTTYDKQYTNIHDWNFKVNLIEQYTHENIQMRKFGLCFE